jgi:signal transduction histidine kinase
MVTNNGGHDVGAAFVLHDITHRKEMEQKLLKAERLASIGELAAILGHDLRNPLSGIRGASYYLKRKYEGILDQEDRAMFESIDKSINYSNKIINDLIDYSSEMHLDLNITTPKSLVNEALALLAPPQNIRVVDQSQETPQVRVDELKVIQGFTNIITNAYDAMPNGGKLTITSEHVGEAVVFCFRDTGQGMNEKTLSKIWAPLFTTKAKGMGFGLAICKRTVEAHSGKVTAKSKPGEGTTITVELPLKTWP